VVLTAEHGLELLPVATSVFPIGSDSVAPRRAVLRTGCGALLQTCGADEAGDVACVDPS
jgi:hypothetical protein